MPNDAAQDSVHHSLKEFASFWLHDAKIAPPAISFKPLSQSLNGVEVTVKPILAEEQPWNQWNGEGHRLFNNRAAHLFRVTIRGTGVLKWIPEKTRLRLNWPDEILKPALRADDLLEPLRKAALTEQQWVLPTQFTKRHRNAGAFRTQYLPLDPRSGKISGILAFPTAPPRMHIMALQLDLTVQSSGGPIPFSLVYE